MIKNKIKIEEQYLAKKLSDIKSLSKVNSKLY